MGVPMRNIVRGAFAAIAMGTAAVSAYAADLPSIKAPPPPPPPVIEPFHPFQVRLKVGGVIPTEGSAYITDRGTGSYLAVPGINPWPQTALNTLGYSGGPTTPFFGANTNISSSIVPMIDVAYYLTKNWAIEAICCVTPHHVTGVGPLQGASVIKTWVFPPSLMLQYHFTNFGAFQPYVGVGVNFTAFWGTRAGNQTQPIAAINPALATAVPGFTAWTSAYSASITPSWGVVGQAGIDYMFNDRWGVNVDVKYIMMEPTAHVWAVANTTPVSVGSGCFNCGPVFVPLNLAVKINPVVISGGLTYRFGADWGVPRLF
jgi:outer membrane protein